MLYQLSYPREMAQRSRSRPSRRGRKKPRGHSEGAIRTVTHVTPSPPVATISAWHVPPGPQLVRDEQVVQAAIEERARDPDRVLDPELCEESPSRRQSSFRGRDGDAHAVAIYRLDTNGQIDASCARKGQFTGPFLRPSSAPSDGDDSPSPSASQPSGSSPSQGDRSRATPRSGGRGDCLALLDGFR